MENQSNNENKVTCRKCGGPHFTIKCGKEKKPEEPVTVTISTVNDNKPLEKNNKTKFVKSEYKDRKPFFKTTYRVKITDLPTNMTEEEMMELTCDWGHVVRIRVNNYYESSTAYIDFSIEEQAEYFIKAINKTPFDSMIITAQRVESVRT